MNSKTILVESARICRVRRLSIHTERTYLGWIARYAEHCRTLPDGTSEEKLKGFLEEMAPTSSASTQSQALNAIVFLYRDVIQRPLGDLGPWARARSWGPVPFRTATLLWVRAALPKSG